MSDPQDTRGQTQGTTNTRTGDDGSGAPYEADVATGPAGTPDDRGLSGGGLIGNADEYRGTVNNEDDGGSPGGDEEPPTRQDLIEKLSEDAGKIVPQ